MIYFKINKKYLIVWNVGINKISKKNSFFRILLIENKL